MFYVPFYHKSLYSLHFGRSFCVVCFYVCLLHTVGSRLRGSFSSNTRLASFPHCLHAQYLDYCSDSLHNYGILCMSMRIDLPTYVATHIIWAPILAKCNMTLQLGRVVTCDTATSPSRECLHFWYVRQNFGCTQIMCLTHSLVILHISSLFAVYCPLFSSFPNRYPPDEIRPYSLISP